jgi:tetratricopeptide (TPR) repeat protein
MRTQSLLSFIILLGSTTLALKGNSETVTGQQKIVIAGKVGSAFKEAFSYYKNKQYDQAISSCTASLPLTSDHKIASIIYGLRAATYIKKNEFKKAVDDANQAVRLDPKNFEAYFQRSLAYGHLEDFEKQTSDSTIAIRLNPNSAKAYATRGASLSFRGEDGRAIADYNEALRRDPKLPDIYYNRGLAQKKLKHFDLAIADFTEAIKRKPTDAWSYSERSSAYFTTGNYRAAASDLSKATQLSPNDKVTFNRLAWFKATCPEASFRNGQEAVRAATKACEQTKWKEPTTIDTLAAAYAETGDFGQALKYETLALKLHQPDPKVRTHLQQHLKLFQNHKPYRQEPHAG